MAWLARTGRARWGMAGLLSAGVLINYFDRTNLSVATVPIEREFHLSPAEFGILLSAFLWCYALLQLPIGEWIDRFGVVWLQRVSTALWAVTTLLTAVVSGLAPLLLFRVLLGVAEAPMFPVCARCVGQWFPKQERGLATSAFDAAAKFSSVIGVPLVALVVTYWGWRGGFVFTGVLSGLYAIAFWVLYRTPENARAAYKLSAEEYEHIISGGARADTPRTGPLLAGLADLLGRRQVWAYVIGYSSAGYAFYLLLTWLPGYLETDLGLSVLKGGLYTAIPWLVATLSDVFIGGVLVDRLIKKGYDQSKVRKTILVCGLILGLVVIGTAYTRDVNLITVLISVALVGVAVIGPIGWSIPALMAPEGLVGTFSAIQNFAGQVVSLIAPIATGFLVEATGSFKTSFLVATAFMVIGIPCILLVMGPIRQLPARRHTVTQEVSRV